MEVYPPARIAIELVYNRGGEWGCSLIGFLPKYI